jgi:predicted metalloprotease with PDZ domain
VDVVNPHADLAGIEQGGYRLVYKDEPSTTERIIAGTSQLRGINYWFSVGLRMATDGNIMDVRWNGPADKARLAPGERIMAVNGKIFSPDVLRAAIRSAKGTNEPIHLIVQSDTFVSTIDLDYHDGERFPVLERINEATDTLDEITKPLTALEKTPISIQDKNNADMTSH